MKKLLLLSALISLFPCVSAQNVFPSIGNVGIGTSTPAYRLDIQGGDVNLPTGYAYRINGQYSLFWDNKNNGLGIGTTNNYAVNIYANSLTSRLSVNTNGNVGIGTTSPDQPLTIIGNLLGKGLHISSTSGAGILLDRATTANSTGVLWQTAGTTDWYLGAYNGSNLYLRYGPGGWIGTDIMAFLTNGNVLIGKAAQTNTSYKLDVNGNIRGNKVVVNTTGADYVFDSTYHLPQLDSLNIFIKKYHHLPDVPSAEEIKMEGLNVGDNQMRLLKKIEELTLIVIEQNKKQKELQNIVNEQSHEIKVIESKLK